MSQQIQKLQQFLTDKQADFTLYEDNFSLEKAAEGAKQYGITLSETSPTLILKSKDNYYAAIICGNTRISFKKLKLALGVKDISMADPDTITRLTGAKIGEISLINENIKTIIDQQVLKNDNCYGGCGAPKTTLRINTDDLIRITGASVLDFTEVRS